MRFNAHWLFVVLAFICHASVLTATSNKIKVKNITNNMIEFTVYMSGDLTNVKTKNIEMGKSQEFTVDLSTVEGIGWKIASTQNVKCKNWFRLNAKSKLVESLRLSKKDATITIDKNGTSLQAVVGKLPEALENMAPFSSICGK